jgi:hypothetical protein
LNETDWDSWILGKSFFSFSKAEAEAEAEAEGD